MNRPVNAAARHSARVLDWFRANPDEELMTKDLMRMFDMSRTQADWAIRTLSQRKEIERVNVVRLRARGIPK